MFTRTVQIEGWLQMWCYLYRGVITSDMFADLVRFSDIFACMYSATLLDMHVGFVYLDMCVFVKASVLLQIHHNAYR